MNTNLTEIVVVLDRSGSMGRIRDGVISGYKSFIRGQQECEGEAVVTMVQFSDAPQVIYKNLPLDKAVTFGLGPYVTRGRTAMLDALIQTIDAVGQRLSDTPEAERPGKVIFVVMTDGDENASRVFTGPGGYQICRDRIKHQTDVYGWDFLYLGANQDAVLTAEGLGFNPGSAQTYTYNGLGAESALQSTTMRVRSLRVDASQDVIEDKQ